MFTPPPSPQPTRPRELSFADAMREPPLEEGPEQPSSSQAAKRLTGRRFRLAVLLVPLAIILITARVGYTTTRVNVESSKPLLPIIWHGVEGGSSWRHHKRHPEPQPDPQGLNQLPASSSTPPTSAASSATPSSSGTPISLQPVPTIPQAPPTLPTPFPQPFDGSIAQNFSSLSCSNFFTNMTNSAPFRQCRPFSMLLLSSTQFITAQTNLTLMNSIIWGTCNTNVALSQCQQNMGWFAGALKSACVDDLKDMNDMTTSSLTALQAYTVMQDVACQANPTTNTYCYLEAVRSSNPTDTYYYGLPLGLPVPKTAQPTCSACSKSVMSVYASALGNGLQAPQLTELSTTYGPTVQLTAQSCGANFAQTVNSAASPSLSRSSWILAGYLTIFAWMTLAYAL